MKLAEFLGKNIIDSAGGEIINKIKITNRRNVFFFGDIFANYISHCEVEGYGTDIRNVAREWSVIINKTLFGDNKDLHDILSTLHVIWTRVGLTDSLEVFNEGQVVKIKTKNEYPVRLIGKNSYSLGLYEGIFHAVNQLSCKSKQTVINRTESIYEFDCLDKPLTIDPVAKKMSKITSVSRKDFDLKDALSIGLFTLNNNQIRFRGRELVPFESTIFHLLGNKNICIEALSDISYKYFNEIIADASQDFYLTLLKSLLQSTGWGNVTILLDNDITITLNNPPRCLDEREENWQIIAQMIHGYLRMFGDFSLTNIKDNSKNVLLKYKRLI